VCRRKLTLFKFKNSWNLLSSLLQMREHGTLYKSENYQLRIWTFSTLGTVLNCVTTKRSYKMYWFKKIWGSRLRSWVSQKWFMRDPGSGSSKTIHKFTKFFKKYFAGSIKHLQLQEDHSSMNSHLVQKAATELLPWQLYCQPPGSRNLALL
jgi:hypothetical protein